MGRQDINASSAVQRSVSCSANQSGGLCRLTVSNTRLFFLSFVLNAGLSASETFQGAFRFRAHRTCASPGHSATLHCSTPYSYVGHSVACRRQTRLLRRCWALACRDDPYTSLPLDGIEIRFPTNVSLKIWSAAQSLSPEELDAVCGEKSAKVGSQSDTTCSAVMEEVWRLPSVQLVSYTLVQRTSAPLRPACVVSAMHLCSGLAKSLQPTVCATPSRAISTQITKLMLQPYAKTALRKALREACIDVRSRRKGKPVHRHRQYDTVRRPAQPPRSPRTSHSQADTVRQPAQPPRVVIAESS